MKCANPVCRTTGNAVFFNGYCPTCWKEDTACQKLLADIKKPTEVLEAEKIIARTGKE